MEVTQPVEWLGKEFEGYVVNGEFSTENSLKLASIIQLLSDHFGDTIFTMPAESLHVTLLDWIAPLIDYDQQKSALFSKISDEFGATLAEIIAAEQPIKVHFDTVNISPTTIFITGSDNGAFERIRRSFIEQVQLPPHTKRPPQIIHSSLARFTKSVDLSTATEFVASLDIDFVELFSGFRLVKTSREPMLEFETLRIFPTKHS